MYGRRCDELRNDTIEKALGLKNLLIKRPKCSSVYLNRESAFTKGNSTRTKSSMKQTNGAHLWPVGVLRPSFLRTRICCARPSHFSSPEPPHEALIKLIWLLLQKRPFIPEVIRSRTSRDHGATLGRHTRSRVDGKTDRPGVYPVEHEVQTASSSSSNDDSAHRSPGCSPFLVCFCSILNTALGQQVQ